MLAATNGENNSLEESVQRRKRRNVIKLAQELRRTGQPTIMEKPHEAVELGKLDSSTGFIT